MSPIRPNLDDLDGEMREHIEAETEDNIARGMSEADARAAAIRKFGNVARIKEDVREVWVPRWIDHLRQDARDAARRLRRDPAFSAIVILTLALGIGVTTTVYSVVNAVLVRPLSFPDADRLVWFATIDPVGGPEMLLGIDFVEWKAQATGLEDAVAYTFGDATFAGEGEASRVRVVSATDGFWKMTGGAPALGRLPAPDDQRPLVVSHRFFVDRLGGNPNAIGRPVMLDGEQATVVGVLPAAFAPHLPSQSWRPGQAQRATDMFRPLVLQPNPDRTKGQRNVAGIGKMPPGTTVAGLLAELDAIRARAVAGLPAPFNRLQVRVRPLQHHVVGSARFALSLLLAAALVVLAITCVNVANLLLARSSARQREIALRMSVGGGPLRIVRQLLIESLAFALLGGAAGIAVAYGLLALVLRVMTDAVPRLSETTIDAPVLAFATLTSVLTAVVFGLGPAVALSRTRVQDVLKAGGRHYSASRGTLRAGRLMVSVQLALTLLLLAGAGLMLKSVWRMQAHPPGFEPARILTMRIDFKGPQYRQPEPRVAYARSVLAQLPSIAGVRDSALATFADSSLLVIEEGQPADRSRPAADVNVMSARFAPMLGMQLLRGRWLANEEPDGAVLINDHLARTQFAGRDPIGVRIRVPASGAPRYAPIVGIVADMKYSKVDADTGPEMFVHYDGPYVFGITVMVKTDGDSIALAPAVRAAVANVDPTQSIFDVQTLEQSLNASIAHRRFNMMLLVSFAALALFLATLGLYGVVAYAVAQRTNEIGIRMALGAHRFRVVRMIVRDGMISTLAGILLGLLATSVLARLMTDLLYGVDARDVSTFVVVTATLVAIAFAGCLVPALKAALVDPVIALRAE